MNKEVIQNQIKEFEGSIKELESKVKKLKEELNKPKNKVFKPKFGDTYYYICVYGEVGEKVWGDDKFDKAVYALGNCFETEEEAEFEIERLKVITELKRFALEHNEPLDWNNGVQFKYYISFSTQTQDIYYHYTFSIKQNDIYFSSKGIAKQAVKEIGEDRIKKYYLGVEE